MPVQIRTNANEIMRGLTQKILNPERLDNALKITATTILAELKTRVFEDGQATDSGKIGDYSTKPLYVSASASPRSFGAPTGKTGRSRFANGQLHKSKYFPDGYKGFRGAVGRDTSKVNLSLSGQFAAQMTVIQTAKGYGIGWTNREMFNRAGAFTKKYNKFIWKLTDNERTLAIALAKKYYVESINGTTNE